MQLIELLDRQRDVAHRDGLLAAVDRDGQPAARGHREGGAGPPMQPCRFVSVHPVDEDLYILDRLPAQPDHGVPEHLGFEPALVVEDDMAVLCAAHGLAASRIGPE
ncbi:hypothetical protein ACFFX0_09880 [Citricoccus parietis]|uniref:Uncharacterized protein n=1 Tax=Citricoccus parietis TaxID=592307 RepID=A0ABV5FYK3_9MICC